VSLSQTPPPLFKQGSSVTINFVICLILSVTLIVLDLNLNFKVKENPLPWLEWVLNGADHTNFFENRVTEYEVAGLSGTWDDAYEAA